MLAKYTIAGLAGTALLATVAFAQRRRRRHRPKPRWRRRLRPTMASPSTFQGTWRASKVVGLSVYNDKNESLGSINDL